MGKVGHFRKSGIPVPRKAEGVFYEKIAILKDSLNFSRVIFLGDLFHNSLNNEWFLFDNWVKERGLYFASKWHENYTPLFMMSDDNEQPLLGGLLVTDYGKGRYIHCALNLFYQMDNLVPGAFRMFANILKS